MIKSLGYFVDGYNKQYNIVYEVDESYHYARNDSLRRKDVLRQKEIEDYLHCKFIRIRESYWLETRKYLKKSIEHQSEAKQTIHNIKIDNGFGDLLLNRNKLIQ